MSSSGAGGGSHTGPVPGQTRSMASRQSGVSEERERVKGEGGKGGRRGGRERGSMGKTREERQYSMCIRGGMKQIYSQR